MGQGLRVEGPAVAAGPAVAVVLAVAAVLAIAAAALLLSSCYVTAQGARYLGIVAGARPADRLIADPSTDQETRLLLERAAAIRAYGVSELGLRDTKSYRSLARVQGPTLSYVVQACAELSFTRHEWDYPFVGRLPYRGYFTVAEAQAEAARLKAAGLDVIVRHADAFSTLGYLPDPLFSFMTRYDEFRLAELILHEMTHATVFARGGRAGNFNEELASFVGRRGALLWLARERGESSAAYREAAASSAAASAFSYFMRDTARQLDAAYRSVASPPETAPSLDTERLRAEKRRIIAARAAEFAALATSDPMLAPFASYPMASVNNAVLDHFRLYDGEDDRYERYFEEDCASDLAAFIGRFRDAKDPLSVLPVTDPMS